MRTAVVIPVYNEQSFIKACLEALSRQTLMPDTVLIVNNNCTDDTLSIALQYPFVTVINETRQGICAATKKGLDTAAEHYDIILRCDADCIPPPTWVERTMQRFNDKDIQVLTGPGEFYDLAGVKKWFAELCYMKMYFWCVGAALHQKPVFGSNFALRASIWKRISNATHLDRQDIHDDMDMSYHLIAHSDITYDPSNIMPISARPFASLRSLLKRYPIGMRSIILHWPAQTPWRLRTVNK